MPSKAKQPSSVNINITNDDNTIENNDTESEKQFNVYKEYIIKNNILLQKENNEFREKIKELESLILQQESEEDKYDNRMRYAKGLLNNLYELKNLYNNQCKNHKSISNSYIEYESKIYEQGKIFYIKNVGLNGLFIFWNLLILFTYSLSNNYYFICGITINILIIYQIYNLYNYYYNFLIINNNKFNNNHKNTNTKINSFNDEIKKLEETTTSLDIWICEI